MGATGRHKHEGNEVVPHHGKYGIHHSEDVAGFANHHLHTNWKQCKDKIKEEELKDRVNYYSYLIISLLFCDSV